MCAELASATRSKVECISLLKWVFDICFTGDFCQCSKDGGDSNQELEERCEAGGRVCSGHGTCDCGVCLCKLAWKRHTRQDLDRNISYAMDV